MSVITLSRELGSGGREIARGVAEKLSYDYIDREVILEAGKKYSVPEKKLEEVFDKRPGFVERFIEDQKTYLIFIEDIISNFALQDNIVIVGSGGQVILKDIGHVLRVRITAPFSKRVETIMKREAIDEKKAWEIVSKDDKARMSRINYLLNVDWSDPTLYDLAINTEALSKECVMDMIINTVKREEFVPTEQSKNQLKDKALTCSIRARLASHPLIMMSNLNIITKDGVVTIAGSVLNKNQKSLIIEIVEEIVGDRYADNLSIVHSPQGDFF